ncbi:hypothetical protein HNY73_020420 [Argiope bruennichi]|uniref:Uncharacterized protein n=1 Tax=Argiope bruennichi TaxID=94029 RepID=A0A8T0E800_ARGBR|nr:hypothetical protein HNY73_020420 [Argiope bruennichi]
MNAFRFEGLCPITSYHNLHPGSKSKNLISRFCNSLFDGRESTTLFARCPLLLRVTHYSIALQALQPKKITAIFSIWQQFLTVMEISVSDDCPRALITGRISTGSTLPAGVWDDRPSDRTKGSLGLQHVDLTRFVLPKNKTERNRTSWCVHFFHPPSPGRNRGPVLCHPLPVIEVNDLHII